MVSNRAFYALLMLRLMQIVSLFDDCTPIYKLGKLTRNALTFRSSSVKRCPDSTAFAVGSSLQPDSPMSNVLKQFLRKAAFAVPSWNCDAIRRVSLMFDTVSYADARTGTSVSVSNKSVTVSCSSSTSSCVMGHSGTSTSNWKNEIESYGTPTVLASGYIRSIKAEAFSGCSAIEKVDLSRGKYLAVLDSGCFRNCLNLADVSLPASVVYIGQHAFEGCSNLASFNIESSEEVLVFGEGAFQNCQTLKTISTQRSRTFISHLCFGSCASLESVSFRSCDMSLSEKQPWNSTYLNSMLGRFSTAIRNNVSTSSESPQVSDSSFSGCHSLRSVSLGYFCDIHSNAFYTCDNIEYVLIEHVDYIDAAWRRKMTYDCYEPGEMDPSST